MNTQPTIEETKREFQEYSSQGYAGGESGLRCDKCDNKYSGTSAIKQLCPMCKAESALQAHEKQVREEILNVKVIAEAIANARASRKGVPAISNVLDILPESLKSEVFDDADSVVQALKSLQDNKE